MAKVQEFYVHVIPEYPNNGDRGVVYKVNTTDKRAAISAAKEESKGFSDYSRADGRLIWSATQ